MLTEDPIYTVQELAEHAKCRPATIYQLIYDGKLKAFPLNPGKATRKTWRVCKSQWDRFTQGTGK